MNKTNTKFLNNQKKKRKKNTKVWNFFMKRYLYYRYLFMRKKLFNALVGQFSILPFVVPVCLHLLYIGCTLTTTLNTISWFASLCIRPSMLMLMLMLVVVDCVSRAGLLSLPTSMIILS